MNGDQTRALVIFTPQPSHHSDIKVLVLASCNKQVASHPRVEEYYTTGPGKATGDGAPPLPPSPPHSPLSPITLPGGDDPA